MVNTLLSQGFEVKTPATFMVFLEVIIRVVLGVVNMIPLDYFLSVQPDTVHKYCYPLPHFDCVCYLTSL